MTPLEEDAGHIALNRRGRKRRVRQVAPAAEEVVVDPDPDPEPDPDVNLPNAVAEPEVA